jgi:LuxR family maltose regulon positive regulatory protein
MLRGRTQPFVLVLDDSDWLTSPASWSVVSTLADHLPDGSQLVLLARRAPPLDWNDMRAKRRVTEIGTSQLRLGVVEAQALVEATGLDLGRHDIEELVERTEGWSAGIYLAALSLSAAEKQRRAARSAIGSDSLFANYLREELLANLPAEDQTFLTRASILSKMSGPLCDVVVGVADSQSTLQRLSESNMLVVRADREGQWFRLHQLFGEALRTELGRREPQMVKKLHCRASYWLEENDEIEPAICHAISAGEVDRAARLIWTQVPDYLASGRVATLEQWLDGFTSRQVAAHAKLALTAAWCAIQRGRPADHWLSATERGLYEASREHESESVASATALTHAVLARNGVLQMGADAQLALRLQQPDDPWVCVASLLAAIATYLSGRPAGARLKLEEVENLSAELQDYQSQARALSQLALLVIDDNDWDTAADLVKQAEALLREHGLDELPTLVTVHCASALLAARAGEAEQAASLARRSLSMAAMTAHMPAWEGVQVRCVLARTQLMLGDTAAARVLLSEAHALLADVPDAAVLRDAVEQTWRQVEKLPLGMERGASTLTTAELRVLQYLPTHLSFEQIGRQLYVSRNTVKTQAIAAYRKLGVSSRSEAVECAYALGLMVK